MECIINAINGLGLALDKKDFSFFLSIAYSRLYTTAQHSYLDHEPVSFKIFISILIFELCNSSQSYYCIISEDQNQRTRTLFRSSSVKIIFI